MEKISFNSKFLNKKRNKFKEEFNGENIKEEYMSDEIQIIKSQLSKLSGIIENNRSNIDSLKTKVFILENDNKKLREDIFDLRIQKKKLEINNIKLSIDNKKLKNSVSFLERQVKLLSEFVFTAKLHKLLKKLLEYIITTYFPFYIKYNPKENKIYFENVPSIYGISKYIIKNALNKILKIIFSNIIANNYVIHFDDKGRKNEFDKKNIEVFKEPGDFFNYFNISRIDEYIIKKLIPDNYFKVIDNYAFDINMDN